MAHFDQLISFNAVINTVKLLASKEDISIVQYAVMNFRCVCLKQITNFISMS